MTPAAARKGGRTKDKEAVQTAPAPVLASRRPSRLRPLHQGLGIAACGGMFAAVCLFHFWIGLHSLPLFLFLSALALLAVLLPVAGPRGLRVGLLPAVGLAGLLLLPPGLALVPILLANTAFALTRPLPLSRRMAHERGASLGLALLAGGLAAFYAKGGDGSLLAAAVYAFVFLASRLLFTQRLPGARAGRGGTQQGWQVEAATLAASAPTALLMAAAFPRFGLTGLSGLAALFVLLGVVAHLGFEAAALRDQVRAMETLSAVTVSQTSPTRVTSQFLHLSRKLVPCDRLVLWLTDESDMRLKRAAPGGGQGVEDVGEAVQSVRFGEGLAGRTAERRKPLFVRDGACDPRSVAEEQPEAGRRELSFALLLVPLVAGNRALGVIQFERDAPGTFTRRDLSRIRALASQAAATLANVHAHRDIYSQAVTDALTGLHNRRHMQTVLADECRRAQRYGHPLSVIMLDVDGFKSYNDTYGHVQGDALLRMLAGILQASVRGVDSVGRFGGEEFVVVLPETPAGEAYQAAERLRLAVARASFPGHAGAPGIAVCKTISLGTATFPDITEDVEALVTLADGALYRAKRGGRNQTIQAAEPTLLKHE